MNGKVGDGAVGKGKLTVMKTHFVRLLRPGPVSALLIWQGSAFGLIPVCRPAPKAQSFFFVLCSGA